MTFGSPIWLALLTLAPLLAWLHRRRKRSEVVGSLLIWRRLVGSSTDTERRGRVRVNWPLVLQVLIVVTAATALSEPRIGFGRADGHHVFLFDVSASMLRPSSSDLRPLDEAFDWLAAEVGALPQSARVSVLLVGPRPEPVLAGATGGRATARRLIRPAGWEAAADWPRAMEALRALVPSETTMTVTVLTSTVNAPHADAELDGSADAKVATRVLRFGEPTANVGLVGARWQVVAGSETALQLSAEVATDGPGRDVAAAVSYRLRGTETFLPWETTDIEVPEAGSTSFQLALDLPGPGTLRVTLASGDANPLDDSVELPVDFDVATRILVVGPPPEALERVLGLLRGVQAFQTNSLPADVEPYDLVIITDPTVASVPRTATLWLGSFPGGASGLDAIASPVITSWDFDHRLAAAASWSDLEIGRAYVTPLLSGATEVASSGHVPLVQTRFGDAGLQVVVGFALADSNWTQLPGFPSFVAELLEMVEPEEQRHGLAACVVASTCPLPREAQGTAWRLIGPGADHPVTDSASAMVPVSDGFAEAYWPFDTGRSFVPTVPGTYLLETARSTVMVPVVADRGAFAVPIDDVTSGPAQEDVHVGVPASPSNPLTVLIVCFLAFAVAHAIVVLRRRTRGARSRVWVSFGVALFVPVVAVAALLRLPWPSVSQAADAVLVRDARESSALSTPRRPLPTTLAGAREVVVVGLDATAPSGGGTSTSADRSSDVPEARAITIAGTAAALEIAAAYAVGTGSNDVVLLQPSSVVLPSSIAEMLSARMRVLGVRVSSLDDSVERAPDLRIESIEVPGGIRAGAVAEVGATIWSPDDRDARFTVDVGGEAVLDADLSLQPGSNSVTFPVGFDAAGVVRMTVSVVESTMPPTTTRTEIVEVGPPLKAMIVATDPTAGDALARALELQGFLTLREPPLNLPWDRDGWRSWDLVVLMNVPAHALHSTQLDGLKHWVVEDGGGLLILGGETSFGPGGYLRTALDELSPLSSQVPREAPEVTMLFVLDRSGSMQQLVGAASRMNIAKEATLSAMGLLGPESSVGVIVYDAAAEVLVPIESVQNLDSISERVATIGASGGTALYPALVEADAMLAGVASSAVHVVVLTDGMSQPGDFEGILRSLRTDGATVSFVGIGSGADRVQLGDLARFAGGALHVTDDVRSLPSILAQEALMASEELVEERTVEVTRRAAIADGFEAVPSSGTVHGYVLTEAKPTADVLLWTVEDEPAPVLATWRFGLGRVVAFTSHGAGRWSRDLFTVEEYSGVWGQLGRWASATDVVPDFSVSLDVERASILVNATLVGDDEGPLSGRRVRANLVTPVGDASASTWLTESRPGVYLAALDVAGAGDHLVRVEVVDGTFEPMERWVHVPPIEPGGPELAEAAGLDALIVTTGGTRAAIAGEVVGRSSRGVVTWRPAFRPWLLVALLVFLAHVLMEFGASVRGAIARYRSAAGPTTRRQAPEPG